MSRSASPGVLTTWTGTPNWSSFGGCGPATRTPSTPCTPYSTPASSASSRAWPGTATWPRTCSRRRGCASWPTRTDSTPTPGLAPWLFAVARNLHVSYCRSRAVEMSHADAGIGLWPAIVPDSPFEQAVGEELERRLEAAIAGLPVIFREVLLLVGVEGLRPAEAAGVCGISPEALRQRLKRARALLQQRLGESQTSRGIREVHHVVPRTTRSNP